MIRHRNALLRLHRWAGLLLAGFLIMAGLTGSIIAFSDPLDVWLNPDLFRVRQNGPRLPLDDIVARFTARQPDTRITYLEFNVPPGSAIRAWVDRATHDYNEVFLDPVSGEILGHRLSGGCCLGRHRLIPFIYKLHSELMAGVVGQWIMGSAGFIWFLDCFVGLALTVPKAAPYLVRWRKSWGVKRHAGSFRLTFDLHRAVGLWLWILLPAIAFSGFAMDLDRPVFRPALGLILPLTPDGFSRAMTQPVPPDPGRKRLGQDQMVTIAEHALRPRWNGPAGSLFCLDALGTCAVYFFPAPGNRGRGLGSPVVYLDDSNGAIRDIVWPNAGSAGDLVARLQFPIHSGQVAGLAGKIVVCACGLATATLTVTGLLIWWRKRRVRLLVQSRKS